MKIAPLGPVIRRVCSSCELEQPADGPLDCPKCGARLVEVRGVADELFGTVILDRFEIRDKLGQGGMGTVYRAWQRSVRREVAIKLIEPSYGKDPMAVQRFEREAQLASQLSQPNTVSVIDFGQAQDGRLFIAMELIRGRTLGALLNTEGKFSVERAVRIGTQICDALEAAHELGIVHRDLKLDNVSVLDHPPGRDLVKVLDFGLAKQFRDLSRGTAAGIVVGTPRYMAPETATDGITQPAGDIYALGVILAELTIGRALWEGSHLAELLTHKLHPAAAIAAVPQPLRPIVAAMIAPEAAGRPTAAEARAQLLALLTGAAPVQPSVPRTEPNRAVAKRRWQILAAGVVIGVVIGGLGAADAVLVIMDDHRGPLVTPDDAHRDPTNVAPELITKPEPITIPPGSADPHETRVALKLDRGGEFEIWERDLLIARGPAAISIRDRAARDLVIRARGFRQLGVRVDGALDEVVLHLEPKHRDEADDCTHLVLDPRSKRCVDEFCAAHPNDERCQLE